MHTKYESMCPTLAKKDTLQSLAPFACSLFHMRGLSDDPYLLDMHVSRGMGMRLSQLSKG